MITKKISAVLILAVCLVGCSRSPQPLYYWGDYQKTIYQYYQTESDSTGQQIASLQAMIERSRASNKALPPGVHAHLGMLYAKTGRAEQAVAEFNMEKLLFPESAPFMNFLISKDKGSRK